MGFLEQVTVAVGDRYRVERELGQGGMAIVFLALDLKYQRPVAIKLLRPEISAALGSERFLREIAIAATLQHPHILPLYDSGEAGGLVYYVMPFVEGESLRQRLAREAQLPIDTAVEITREVGSALQYAHEHGVIHRDIKPDNIMLTGGHAVVMDFGIARALHAAGTAQLTQSGMVVGTPQYMSPEQAGGDVLDGRCDQYSLACTLYEMLSGQPPFTGSSSAAVLARHALEPVPSLRIVRQTVPVRVEETITRAMAKAPADRFASMEGFLAALAAPDGASARSTVAAGVGSRRRVLRLTAAVAGVVLLAAAAWWTTRGRTSSPAAGVTAIAILPFQDLTSSPDSSYLGAGMTDGLVADLAQVGSLKVISRASGELAQGTARSLTELAGELGVQAVVRGTIERAGDTVRVQVRFLRAPDSTVLLSRDYRRRLGELPDLQRQITTDITGAVSARLQGTEQGRLGPRGEVDQRAYEAWLRGRFSLERDELDQARGLFEQASAIAPNWAPPLVGLANYYTTLPFVTDIAPAEVLPKARAALAHALELDADLPEAHAANAYIRAYYEWDWRAAEQEYRRAIELRPNYADAYFSYARFLASRKRIDEAIAQLGRAVELDPLSLGLQANRALLDYFAGRYAEADSGLGEVLKRDSTDVLARWGKALVAEQQGRLDEAIAILERVAGSSNNRRSSLGHAYAVAGKTAKARKILADLHAAEAKSYVPAYWFALLHAGLGERAQALRHLERAYTERSTVLAYLLIDPRLTSLRSEPRFVALTRLLGGQ